MVDHSRADDYSRSAFFRELFAEEEKRQEKRCGVVHDVGEVFAGMEDKRVGQLIHMIFHAVDTGIAPWLEDEQEQYVFKQMTLLLKG